MLLDQLLNDDDASAPADSFADIYTDYVVAEPFLSDEVLQHLAGCERLSEVRYLSMTVDTSDNTLSDLGRRLPHLDQLRLSHSNISTLRDLGTALRGLQVLWLARSGLRDLEGIGALESLRELYVAFNDVSDLSPLMATEGLETLDLEANAIDDVAQVQYLLGCTALQALTLEANPVFDQIGYRAAVHAALPALALLDDSPLLGDSPLLDESALSGAVVLGGSLLEEGAPAALRERDEPAAAAPAQQRRALPGSDSIGRTQLNAAEETPSAGASGGLDVGGAGSSGACDGTGGTGAGAEGEVSSELAACRRERKLVTDALKYAGTLRGYDVQSREALSPCTGATGRPQTASSVSGGSRALSPRSDSSRGRSATGQGRSSGLSSALTSPRGSTGGGRKSSSCASSRASTARPSSARGGSSRGGSAKGGFSGGSRDDEADASSHLTHGHGAVLCGMPMQMLRARRLADAAAEEGREGCAGEALLAGGTAESGEPEGDRQHEMLEALVQFKLQQAMRGAADEEAWAAETPPLLAAAWAPAGRQSAAAAGVDASVDADGFAGGLIEPIAPGAKADGFAGGLIEPIAPGAKADGFAGGLIEPIAPGAKADGFAGGLIEPIAPGAKADAAADLLLLDHGAQSRLEQLLQSPGQPQSPRVPRVRRLSRLSQLDPEQSQLEQQLTPQQLQSPRSPRSRRLSRLSQLESEEQQLSPHTPPEPRPELARGGRRPRPPRRLPDAVR